MATTTFSIKLLIDTKANRVLFAEAGKDAIDFLFILLTLPTASVTKLLTRNRMVGCIGNLYGSVESLNDTYVHSKQNMESLLNPELSANVPLLMLKESVTNLQYYRCGRGCSWKITDAAGVSCPNCRNTMTTVVEFFDSETNKGVATFKEGFVKEVVTYMVMDDLVVTPQSTISGITILNKFNVENVKFLEEKVVDFGMEEGLELLEASLQTKMVLTQVFLRSKEREDVKES